VPCSGVSAGELAAERLVRTAYMRPRRSGRAVVPALSSGPWAAISGRFNPTRLGQATTASPQRLWSRPRVAWRPSRPSVGAASVGGASRPRRPEARRRALLSPRREWSCGATGPMAPTIVSGTARRCRSRTVLALHPARVSTEACGVTESRDGYRTGARRLSWGALGPAGVAAFSALVTVLPGVHLHLPDALFATLFAGGLVLCLALALWRGAAAGRATSKAQIDRFFVDLPSTWRKAWPDAVWRIWRVGFVAAVVSIGLSLYRLRHGNATIEHGQYFLFNHGPVRPISHSAWLALRDDEQRLFMTGAAIIWIAVAGLLRMPSRRRRL
jgi:hypothetical protein